ncbi:MAG: phosphate signaling complex protein PhoU [Dehalococcoidia bacterium]|nr:phosphate signaling complex protein PhoU [Dehalococcoidia bacterium]
MNTDNKNRLQEIQDNVQTMAGAVTKAIHQSVEALKKRDLRMAHQVMADDVAINKQRYGIENDCVELNSAQHLAAGDFQVMVAVLNIIVELERIGDYADGIANIVVMIGDEPPLKPLIDIPRMAELTVDMVSKSVRAFINRDAELAKQVVTMDDAVDGLFDQVFRELLTFMMSDSKTINRATRLIWVAHNLERAADRATNICERVVYMVTGKGEEIGGSKY